MKKIISLVIVLTMVLAIASTAFAVTASYSGTASSNFNTTSKINASAGSTGLDNVYSANKSSWTSRIYSSLGQAQNNANTMTPNSGNVTQALNSNAVGDCYLNVKNSGSGSLIIPSGSRPGSTVANAYWGIY